jgi:hypothetical protein
MAVIPRLVLERAGIPAYRGPLLPMPASSGLGEVEPLFDPASGLRIKSNSASPHVRLAAQLVSEIERVIASLPETFDNEDAIDGTIGIMMSWFDLEQRMRQVRDKVDRYRTILDVAAEAESLGYQNKKDRDRKIVEIFNRRHLKPPSSKTIARALGMRGEIEK